MLRNKTVLELCDPEPFTVATWILMSLTTRFCPTWPDDPRGATSVVAITLPFWSETLLSRANSIANGVFERSENPSVYLYYTRPGRWRSSVVGCFEFRGRFGAGLTDHVWSLEELVRVWIGEQLSSRHEIPNYNVGGCRLFGCGILGSLFLSNSSNSDNFSRTDVDSYPFNLPNCVSQFLFSFPP